MTSTAREEKKRRGDEKRTGGKKRKTGASDGLRRWGWCVTGGRREKDFGEGKGSGF